MCFEANNVLFFQEALLQVSNCVPDKGERHLRAYFFCKHHFEGKEHSDTGLAPFRQKSLRG